MTAMTGYSHSPLKLINITPVMAITNPIKKFTPCFSLKKIPTITATKNGAHATMIPTFDAYVIDNAVFSSKKYSTKPVSAAPAKHSSRFLSLIFTGCGLTKKSAINKSFYFLF